MRRNWRFEKRRDINWEHVWRVERRPAKMDFMGTTFGSKAIWRALTTVNAPLPIQIDAETLLGCLLLTETERRWRPHVRAFFGEVGTEVIMDMVVEGSVTFNGLSTAISFWDVDEDYANARWIREMAPVSMAETDGPLSSSGRFRNDRS